MILIPKEINCILDSNLFTYDYFAEFNLEMEERKNNQWKYEIEEENV